MSLVKFSNFSPELFDRFFDNSFFDWSSKNFSNTNTTLPAVNIIEDDNGFEVEMSAPGFEKNDFKIELNQNVLTISSDKKTEDKEHREGAYTRREFSYQSFTRSFTLPDTVEDDKIEAKYEKGLLKLSIPKKEEAKPKPVKLIEIG